MANIQIHAGDFSKGKGTISANDMVFVMSTAWQAGDGF